MQGLGLKQDCCFGIIKAIKELACPCCDKQAHRHQQQLQPIGAVLGQYCPLCPAHLQVHDHQVAALCVVRQTATQHVAAAVSRPSRAVSVC